MYFKAAFLYCKGSLNLSICQYCIHCWFEHFIPQKQTGEWSYPLIIALQSCFWPANGIEGLPSVDEPLLWVKGPTWSVYNLTSLLRKHNARLNLVLSAFSLPNATWIVLLMTYMSEHDTSSVPWASSQFANSFSLFCQLSNSAIRDRWLFIRTGWVDQLHWAAISSQGRSTLPQAFGHCLSCPMRKHCTDLLTTWRRKEKSHWASQSNSIDYQSSE